jgi:CheY-like chemotaxis protein
MRVAKVLVVDDDPIVIENVREMLEANGYEVKTRERSLGTSAVILQWHPDVLLLDVEMPGLSGDGLAELLSDGRKRLDVNIVFYSSRAPASLADVVRRSGALGAIQKTGDARHFLFQLECLLPRRRHG